jgi:uncharacterized DUF497 family protein
VLTAIVFLVSNYLNSLLATLLILPVFTLRKHGDSVLIRPISARYMHKKEVDSYEKSYPDV